MRDEALYAQVAEELRLSNVRPGLWAKAFAESNGDEAQAKALYLRYRVKQLKTAAREAVRNRATVKVTEEQLHAADAKEGALAIFGILIGLPVLILVVAFLF